MKYFYTNRSYNPTEVHQKCALRMICAQIKLLSLGSVENFCYNSVIVVKESNTLSIRFKYRFSNERNNSKPKFEKYCDCFCFVHVSLLPSTICI